LHSAWFCAGKAIGVADAASTCTSLTPFAALNRRDSIVTGCTAVRRPPLRDTARWYCAKCRNVWLLGGVGRYGRQELEGVVGPTKAYTNHRVTCCPE
jgi:hypothetical protein